jgi:hypothetical protein
LIDHSFFYPGWLVLQIMQADVRFVSYIIEQFRCFAEIHKALVVNDAHFLPGEIHAGGNDAIIEFMQVLQEIETTAAMDLGKIECNMRLFLVFITDQLLPDLLIFQESEFIFPRLDALIGAGLLVEIIIFTKAILVEQPEHHPAAFAAESFVIGHDLFIGAGFTAVITNDLRTGYYCFHA